MHGLGAKFSPIDQRDHTITKYAAAQLDKNQPVPEAEAKARLQHRDDQKETLMCSAYTMCNKVTIRIHQRTGQYVKLSPAAFYGNREHMTYKGEAMMGRDTQQAARKSGFIPRDTFPFEAGTYEACKAAFDEKAAYYKEIAVPFRTDGFARLNDAHELAQYIRAEGIGAWIAFRVYENIRNAERTGIIEQPSGSFIGGHAVLAQDIVYRNGQPYIRFANSWGSNWGDHGDGYLPANMMAEGWGDYDRPPMEEDTYPTEFIVFLKDIDDSFNTRTVWTDSQNFRIPSEIGACVDLNKIRITQGRAAAYIEDRTMIILRPLWEAIGWEVNWYGDYVTITKGKTESKLRQELGLTGSAAKEA